MIALVRTGDESERATRACRRFIVDLKSAGRDGAGRSRDLAGDEHFNEVFFDDVFVPDGMLIGEEGDGWGQVTAPSSRSSAAGRSAISQQLRCCCIRCIDAVGDKPSEAEQAP